MLIYVLAIGFLIVILTHNNNILSCFLHKTIGQQAGKNKSETNKKQQGAISILRLAKDKLLPAFYLLNTDLTIAHSNPKAFHSG
jgi:hypothetical protein